MIKHRRGNVKVVFGFSLIGLFSAGALQAAPPTIGSSKTFYQESQAVALKFPDPPIDIPSPAFAEGKEGFTTYAEMETFISHLSQHSKDLQVRPIGSSQEGLSIPLLIFSRPSPSPSMIPKPTILVIGLQHGNEPAGGEAALALAAQLSYGIYSKSNLLDYLNILIVPRANPDGAQQFKRNLVDGTDLNRDHLLLNSPEAKAMAQVLVEFKPDIVIDCHECSVRNRLLEKFHGLQSYDALVQYATVGNLPKKITEISESLFRKSLLRALDQKNYRHHWYFTTTYDAHDKNVSMGGVNPDTLRNVASLYGGAISFLIETRGVQIGPAHFKRRVDTHLTALGSLLETAAKNASKISEIRRHLENEITSLAGSGEITVIGHAKSTKKTLEFYDPDTAQTKKVEVSWNSSLEIDPILTRKRPYAYLLPSTESAAAERLQLLGAAVFQIEKNSWIQAEHYLIQNKQLAKKTDVRRNDKESPRQYLQLKTQVEPEYLEVKKGDYYIPLDQALANLVIAALEPDTETGFIANGKFSLNSMTENTSILPLYRLTKKLEVSMRALAP